MAEKIGTIECLSCDQPIPVKATSGGGVSVCCPWCDLSAYAKSGTQAAKIIARRMKPDATPEPEPAKPPAPAAAKPAKAARPAPVTPASMAGLLIG